MTDLERAIRAVLRLKRGRVVRIIDAIRWAAAEAHISGRIEPWPEGITQEASLAVQQRYEAAAVRALKLEGA